jgi:hypothetical protein
MERISKEAVIAQRGYYLGICPEGVITMKIFSQNSKNDGRVLN